MIRTNPFHLLAAVLLALSATHAYATDFVWNGTTDTSLATAGNWTPAGVPGADDTATISIPATIDSGALTVRGFSISAGVLLVDQSRVTVASAASGAGTFNWSGGTIGGTVSIGAGATMNISGAAGKTLASGTINNAGTVVWTGVGDISGPGTVNNSGTFNARNSQSFNLSNSSNGGAFNNLAGATFLKSVDSGTTHFTDGWDFVDSGLVDVETGVLELNAGSHQINDGARFTGPGRTRLTDTGGGSFATLSNTPANNASATVTLDAGSTLELAANATLTGPDRGPGTLAGAGTFEWSGGIIAGTTLFVIDTSTHLLVSGSVQKTAGVNIDLKGAGIWTGNGILQVTADFTNDGTFDAQSDAVFDSNSSGTNFINHGTLTKSAGVHLTDIEVNLQNTGTINVRSGTLNFGGFSDPFVQTSGSLNLVGGNVSARDNTNTQKSLSLQGGALTGTGTIDASVANTGTGTVSVGTGTTTGVLTIAGDYMQGTNANLTVALGGTTAGSGFDQLAVQGAATLDGTLNVALVGGFTPAAGSNFIILPAGSESGTFLSVTKPAALTVQASYNPTNVTLGVSAATTGVTSPPAASVIVNQPFTYQVTANNNPTSYGASGLPTGLTLNPNTGVISGIPTASGCFTATLTATGASGSVNAPLALTVTETSTPIDTVENISTRMDVQTGNNILIGGVIIQGTGTKRVIVRGIGPSLAQFGIANVLANPMLELRDGNGNLVAQNDNWVDSANKQEIINTSLAPSNDFESAILTTLTPNNYTALVSGSNNGTGVGLVEAFDLDNPATSTTKFANISTRGIVETGNNVMIGGFILCGNKPSRVVVRAIGPSLPVGGALADPVLELHDETGATIATNDNWKDTQEAALTATNLQPEKDAESAIVMTLAPGNYTAIVRGKNNSTGIGRVDVFRLN